jgi:hypothetical protein
MLSAASGLEGLVVTYFSECNCSADLEVTTTFGDVICRAVAWRAAASSARTVTRMLNIKSLVPRIRGQRKVPRRLLPR